MLVLIKINIMTHTIKEHYGLLFEYYKGKYSLVEKNNKPKHTPKGNSYWNDTGLYQKEYEAFYDELVPQSNEADTNHGELIRCISRLTYDYYNNGNCNAVENLMDSCEECGGSGYEETHDDEEHEDYQNCHACDGDCNVHTGNRVEAYYNDMLDYLEINMDDMHLAIELREFLESNNSTNCSFSNEEERIYVLIMDSIMYQCLHEDNRENTEKINK